MAEFAFATPSDGADKDYTGPRRVFRASAYAPSTPSYHWTEDAACGVSGDSDRAGDHEWWDALTAHRLAPNDIRLAQARGICGVCPVRETCLEKSYEDGDTWTFRAGMTPDERRQYKRTGNVPRNAEGSPCAKGHDAEHAVYYRRVNARGFEYWSRRCRICNIAATQAGRRAQGKAS